MLKTRDPFGGSVALWWTAENFMDVAPYINDARAMELILLGGFTGQEVDAHDWNNLLTMLGWLQHDHRLAQLSYGIGTTLMLVAYVGARCSFGNSTDGWIGSLSSPTAPILEKPRDIGHTAEPCLPSGTSVDTLSGQFFSVPWLCLGRGVAMRAVRVSCFF